MSRSDLMPPVHPAAAELPLLQGEEFVRFADDIAANGQREPIVMHNGMILDGRNRWRACMAKRLTPRIVEWDQVGSPIAFVMSANLHRRHLDKSQQALVGARLMPMLAAEAKGRQRKAGGAVPQVVAGAVDARDKAAELVGVSHTMIDAAVEVIRDALPEVLAAVEEGRMTVSAAAKKVRAGKGLAASTVSKAKKPSLVSLNPKARRVIVESHVGKDQKVLLAVSQLPTRSQIAVAHLLSTGEAVTVAEAKRQLVEGAVVSPYSRALAAVRALPADDQWRLCREVTAQLNKETK